MTIGLTKIIKMEKTFTLAQMLNVIESMQQGITPELFESSKNLGSEDFLDLPICKAIELGIEKEFIEHMNSNPNLKQKF